MQACKVVLGELKNDRKQCQEFLNNFVVDMTGKVFNLAPILVDEVWVSALKSRNEFGDVVDLCVVKDARLDLLLIH